MPACDGVPDSVPSGLRVKPGGSDPVADQVNGGVPLLAVNVNPVYAVPSTPFGGWPEVMLGAGAIVIEKSAVAVTPAESVTCAVKVKTPAEVGVPLIAPAAGSSVKPGGRLPAVTLNVYGCFPPDALSVAPGYATPTAPGAKVAPVRVRGGVVMVTLIDD